MKFTFGIITGGNDGLVNLVIDSIKEQRIPEYEIIVVGGNPIEGRDFVSHISFDESVKSKWITRKKNIITEHAKYENIVYLHDYILLEDGWYSGFEKLGNDFDICMTVIKNSNGTRFRDWTLWADLGNLPLSKEDINYISHNRHFLLPYDVDYMTKYQYISGSYWVAKKDVMIENPLDERLCWGESEDVEWSKIVREKYKFTMNPYSSVVFMKHKHISEFYEMDNTTLNIIKKIKK